MVDSKATVVNLIKQYVGRLKANNIPVEKVLQPTLYANLWVQVCIHGGVAAVKTNQTPPFHDTNIRNYDP